jgi:hypothetical protein
LKPAYVDTSCIVALALDERRAVAVRAVLERHVLYAGNLLEAELAAAMQRNGQAFDPAFTEPLSWILPTRALSPEIEAVQRAGYVRGADLWHLACSLYLSPDPADIAFLTVDLHQAAVARALGFETPRELV